MTQVKVININSPFLDQKPGTSGLRKSTLKFQEDHYLEIFIEAILQSLKNLQGSTLTVQFYCSDESMINWVKEIGHLMLLQKLYRKIPKNWVAFASRLDFIKSYK